MRGVSRALDEAPPQDNNNAPKDAPQPQDAAPKKAEDPAPKADDAAPKKADDAAPKAPAAAAGGAKAGTWYTIDNNNPNVVADGNAFKLSIKPEADTAKIVGGEAYNGGTVAFTAKTAAAMPGVVTSVFLTSAKGEEGEATKDQISFDFLGKAPKMVRISTLPSQMLWSQLASSTKRSLGSGMMVLPVDLLSVWIVQVQTNLVVGGENKPKEVELADDSSAAEHKYSVVWDDKGVTWLVDGKGR